MTRRPWKLATWLLVLALSSALGVGGANRARAQAAGVPGVVSVFGRAGSLLIHAWVVAPPGADVNAVANEALASQGARPIAPSEFTTTGLVWPQFADSNATNDFVRQYYNGGSSQTSSEPIAGSGALYNSEKDWTDVTSSKFAFYGPLNNTLDSTSRCPSLVRECPGPQTADGFNDVAWLSIGGCCTLGVTWYSTSANETDMALNTNFNWGPGGYNAQAVFLHENGHVAGLGHSDDPTAVMYAYYNGLTFLQPDDIAGIRALYPEAPGTPTDTPTPTATATSTATPTATAPPGGVSSASVLPIDYATGGGKLGDRHLRVTVTVVDGQGAAVSGAAVAMTLYWDREFYGSYQGTTGTAGSVTFTAKNAPSGIYLTTGNLTNMDLIGGWPTNPFEKP